MNRPTVDPVSLLRTLCRKKSTVALLLRTDNRQGEICLCGGRIVRARCGSFEGEQALFGMLMWPDPRIQIAPLLEIPEVNVFSDFSFLTSDEEALPEACAVGYG